MENHLFPFCSVPPLAPQPVVPKTSKKSSFLSLRVPRWRGWQCTRRSLHTPVPLSFRQWAAGSGSRTRCLTHPLPNRGARQVSHCALRPHTGTHCLPGRVPVFHFTAHSGCIGGSTSPACSVSGGLASAPRRSRWLTRTIRLGYAIQFARRPPKSGGIRFTSVQDKDAPVLRHGPAGEGRDTAGPSSRDEGRVLQPLLHRIQERR